MMITSIRLDGMGMAPVRDERFSMDLLDLLLAIALRKRMIGAWILGAGAVATIMVLLLRNSYSSTAVILPPHQDASMSMLLSGQMGALSSLSGMGGLASGGLSLKNPNDIYVGLLESRTVTSYLVDRFDLRRVFKSKTIEDALKSLASHTIIEVGKDNLIRVTVTTHDAVFSSQLANAYVEQLHDLNTKLALTDSSQRRMFYEQQLDEEQEKLAEAETALRDVQQKTGMMQPAGQADMISRNIATIRAQLTGRLAALQSIRAFASESNPDYIRAKQQVDSLLEQLRQAEDSQRKMEPGDIEVPTSKLPNVTLEYTRTYRQVKLHEAVYEALVRQFEAAKLDEAKTAPMIQIVDMAVPAEKRSGPFRSLIVLAAMLIAFFFASAWTVVSHGFRMIEHDETTAAKLQRLRRELRIGN